MDAAMLTTWWVWVAGGLVLAVAEVLVPGFIFLGFAIGAVVTGLLLAVGVSLTAPWLAVVFAVMSFVGFLVLRRAFPGQSGHVKVWDRDINDN